MESILKQSGDDIDVVYCENDNEAFGAIDAIEAAGYDSWIGERKRPDPCNVLRYNKRWS